MRAFIAIKIPTEIKENLVKLQTTLKINGVKWVEPENIHLTLKFLGEICRDTAGCVPTLQDINSAINSSIEGITPFYISLAELSAFPNLKKPRIIWLGINEGKEQLIHIMTKLNEAFSKLGFESRKLSGKPVPHITIGRIKKVQSFELKVQSFETASFLADQLYLIQSVLTPRGPIYTDISEFQFR